MALRTLGYKNVVESAGTWPTNYITKANELQLLSDMKYDGAEDGAKRGNVAILLWNMLRTEMWDIDSENQTNGMTYRKTEEPMLNIKFPDYSYEDDAKFVSFEVDEEGKVSAEVTITKLVNGVEKAEPVKGEVKNADLLRLVKGMTVAYLYNEDDEIFLTLTAVDTLVEGRLDKDLKLNGKDYSGLDEAKADDYVVALVSGKKVTAFNVLPTKDTYEIGQDKSLKTVQKTLDEDVLVIIDGEWADGTALKEGDVVTPITDLETMTAKSESFYVVARERVGGTFESATEEITSDSTRHYIEVDGDEYENVGEPGVYEYNEKNEEYDKKDFDDLLAKKSPYFDEDVELALNYLGDVVNIYFGETKDADEADIRFFVLTGEHPWFESSKGGMKYYVQMTDVNGDEDTQELSSDIGMDFVNDFEGKGGVYKVLTKAYQDAEEAEEDSGEAALRAYIVENLIKAFNVNDDDQLEEPKDADLADAYLLATAKPADGEDEILNKDNYITDGTDSYKVTKATKVIKVTPVMEDDEVKGLDVEVLAGTDALDGVEEAKFAVEVEDGKAKVRVAYVFVAEDAKSSELHFGKVTRVYPVQRGEQRVMIDGTRYVLSKDSLVPAVNSLVSYRVNGDEITVREEVKYTDINDDAVVTDVDEKLVYIGKDYMDTEADTVVEKYKKYTFVLGTASLNKDGEVEFDDEVEVLGEGLENLELEGKEFTFRKGDRLLEGKTDKVIVVIRGLKADEKIAKGVAQDED